MRAGMRLLGLLSILLAGIAAPPAAALSCSHDGLFPLFLVHDLGENRTVAEVSLDHWAYGSECGFGNQNDLDGSLFAWAEPPRDEEDASADAAGPRREPSGDLLHTLDLLTGKKTTHALPGPAVALVVARPYVVVAVAPHPDREEEGPAFHRVHVEDGMMERLAGDVPPTSAFTRDGGRIRWIEGGGREVRLRTREAALDEPATTQTLRLPHEADHLRLRAANARWAILEHAIRRDAEWAWGLWAIDRATGEVHQAAGLPGFPVDARPLVHAELDGDVLLIQDDSGWLHMGRGRFHRAQLPGGPFERLASPGQPADGFVVDEGRIVLRQWRTDEASTWSEPTIPLPPRAPEPEEPADAAQPVGRSGLDEPRLPVPSPGLPLACGALLAALALRGPRRQLATDARTPRSGSEDGNRRGP